MIVLDFLLIVMFGTANPILAAAEALGVFGLWKLFAKCGADSRLALIPCYREYVLAECGGREPEGRVLFAAMVFHRICALVLRYSPNNTLDAITAVLLLIGTLILCIYYIRVSVGLIEVFGRRKLWIIGWMFADWICAFWWGMSKSFQPRWKLEDFAQEEANYFSGAHADALDQGLTVNINERSVWDFFKKRYLLRDIHMYVKPGSMVLLLGGSGAGKTTFLNAVNGYEKAKAEIVLNGDNVYKELKLPTP